MRIDVSTLQVHTVSPCKDRLGTHVIASVVVCRPITDSDRRLQRPASTLYTFTNINATTDTIRRGHVFWCHHARLMNDPIIINERDVVATNVSVTNAYVVCDVQWTFVVTDPGLQKQHADGLTLAKSMGRRDACVTIPQPDNYGPLYQACEQPEIMINDQRVWARDVLGLTLQHCLQGIRVGVATKPNPGTFFIPPTSTPEPDCMDMDRLDDAFELIW